jgi:hypothetical protein
MSRSVASETPGTRPRDLDLGVVGAEDDQGVAAVADAARARDGGERRDLALVAAAILADAVEAFLRRARASGRGIGRRATYRHELGEGVLQRPERLLRVIR